MPMQGFARPKSASGRASQPGEQQKPAENSRVRSKWTLQISKVSPDERRRTHVAAASGMAREGGRRHNYAAASLNASAWRVSRQMALHSGRTDQPIARARRKTRLDARLLT